MKNYYLIILCFCVFTACKSNKKSGVNDTLGKHTDQKNQSAEIIKKFKPIVQGVWVRSDYINNLKKSKSPYESSAELSGVASMLIQLPDNNSDSTHIGYSLNNHEGSDFILYFKSGQMENS